MEVYDDSDGAGVRNAIEDFATALTLVQNIGALSGSIMLNLARVGHRKYEQSDLEIDDDIRTAIVFTQAAINNPSARLTTRIKAGYLGGVVGIC